MIDQKKIIKTIFSILLMTLIFQGAALGQDEEYHIGPRDVLSLVIHAGGEKQYEVDLTVNNRGEINVPFISTVRAEGLSIPQLENKIRTPLARDYFVSPQVNISVKEYHSLRYYIAGAVSAPGLYEVSSKATLMRLIAKAGGALPDRSNVAYVLRDSAEQVAEGHEVTSLLSHTEPKKADLKALLDKGDMGHDLILQSGDVVYIPFEKAVSLAEYKIYVEGEVRNPGVYQYQPGLTALSACITAGGFNKFAAPNRARIIRKTNGRQEVIKIDLNEVKMGNIPDIELKPGDLINVPETWL